MADSDDDFQSADEGSENEECEEKNVSVFETPRAKVTKLKTDEKPRSDVEAKTPIATDDEKKLESPEVEEGDGDGWDFGDEWVVESSPEAEASSASSSSPTMIPSAAGSGSVPSGAQSCPLERRAVKMKDELSEGHQAVLDKLAFKDDDSAWGSWNNWFADSLNTITSTVGEGITTVFETVESTIGAPPPDELAGLPYSEQVEISKKADKLKEPPVWEEVASVCDDPGSGSDVGSKSSNQLSREDLSSGYQSDSAPSECRTTPPNFGSSPKAFGGFFSQLSSMVESTGKHLVSGSIDVLENLGKKTFEVITEPSETGCGRRVLKGQKDDHSLSKLLLEAKSQSIAKLSESSSNSDGDAGTCFAALFDHYNGCAHLESLELLSDNCRRLLDESHVEASQSDELLDRFEEIECVFPSDAEMLEAETDEDYDTVGRIEEAVKETGLEYPLTHLKRVQESYKGRLKTIRIQIDESSGSSLSQDLITEKIFNQSIHSMAEYTSSVIEMVHKMGQLTLATHTEVNLAALQSLQKFLCAEVSDISKQFSSCLTDIEDVVEDQTRLNQVITDLFFEASNCTSYIQESFQRLHPVLKYRVLKSLADN